MEIITVPEPLGHWEDGCHLLGRAVAHRPQAGTALRINQSYSAWRYTPPTPSQNVLYFLPWTQQEGTPTSVSYRTRNANQVFSLLQVCILRAETRNQDNEMQTQSGLVPKLLFSQLVTAGVGCKHAAL